MFIWIWRALLQEKMDVQQIKWFIRLPSHTLGSLQGGRQIERKRMGGGWSERAPRKSLLEAILPTSVIFNSSLKPRECVNIGYYTVCTHTHPPADRDACVLHVRSSTSDENEIKWHRSVLGRMARASRTGCKKKQNRNAQLDEMFAAEHAVTTANSLSHSGTYYSTQLRWPPQTE